MNPADSGFLTILESRARDLLAAVEFYGSTYEPHPTGGYIPEDALALFATETITFKLGASSAQDYYREALKIPSLKRSIGKQSNTVTVNFSNVSKRLATFVLNNSVAGMRMVIRIISRQNADTGSSDWFVLFVGRCDEPDGFDREKGSITARQDLGQVESKIPPKLYQQNCPLRFKGAECLGTEELTEKSAAYQAATRCNKAFEGNCTDYENTKFFQGLRVVQIPGSFIHRPHMGFLEKVASLFIPGSGRQRIRVGSSVQDGTPYGHARPVVLGRWQMSGQALQYQDTGTAIKFKLGFGHGPFAAIENVRTNTAGFSQPVNLVKHLGEYGGQGTQTQDAAFPDASYHSRLAYITGRVIGSDIAVEEPAPDISAMIGGLECDTAYSFGVWGSGRPNDGEASSVAYTTGIFSGWTDNPVDQARKLLTDAAYLGFSENAVDHRRTAITSIYCMGVVRDETNGERVLLPNTETTKAGVDYHRYNSTGLITPDSWGGVLQMPDPVFDREVDYEFFDPDVLPDTSAVITFYRRRFTCNLAVTEQKPVVDFLYDTLLPTFRGFLSWNWKGQVGVRCERPADSVLVRGAAVATDTTLQVDDVYPWRIPLDEWTDPLTGQILIGVGLPTSEVRTVTDTEYSAAGNDITLTASGSGGPTLTASGANFTGGSTTDPATATVTVSGSMTEGATATITIDGVDSAYTLQSGETTTTLAYSLAAAVNANPTSRRYIEAVTDGSNEVTLRAKLGTLTLDSALEEDHDAGEETIRVMMSFAGKAATWAGTARANNLDGSFKYLGANRQPRYNQFKATFKDSVRDFSEQPVVVNDYDNQDEVQKLVVYEADLSAVDNYNQAARLLNGAAAKYGEGTDFFTWGSAGVALQLEEGDVVCVSDDSGEFRNVPVRIEDLTVNDKFEISFTARLYSTSMYDDEVDQTTVAVPSGLTNYGAPPPDIAFNATDFPPGGLIQTTDGVAGITSVRGGAIFGASVYAQYAKVSVLRPGASDYEQIAVINPDANLESVFEFIASDPGVYTVQLEVCGTWGCNATKPTASITVGLGSNQGTFNVPMLTLSGGASPNVLGSGGYTVPMMSYGGAASISVGAAGEFTIP